MSSGAQPPPGTLVPTPHTAPPSWRSPAPGSSFLSCHPGPPAVFNLLCSMLGSSGNLLNCISYQVFFFTKDTRSGSSALLTRAPGQSDAIRSKVEGLDIRGTLPVPHVEIEQIAPILPGLPLPLQHPQIASPPGVSPEHLQWAGPELESTFSSLPCFLERALGGTQSSPGGDNTGHALLPSTLHRWPPMNRTLCSPVASPAPGWNL